MYYAEKVINGIVYFKTKPKGEWKQKTRQPKSFSIWDREGGESKLFKDSIEFTPETYIAAEKFFDNNRFGFILNY